MSQDALNEFVVGLAAKFPIFGLLLASLGALVVIGQTVILLTPSKEDDAWLAKVWSIPYLGKLLVGLVAFAPIQKKEAEKK